jgi:hypothetical protein
MIDTAGVTDELSSEEQASVLLEVASVALAEALSQGVMVDLDTFESMTVLTTPDGDVKFTFKAAGADPVEILVPVETVQEALGEVGSDESSSEETAEGEPATA